MKFACFEKTVQALNIEDQQSVTDNLQCLIKIFLISIFKYFQSVVKMDLSKMSALFSKPVMAESSVQVTLLVIFFLIFTKL